MTCKEQITEIVGSMCFLFIVGVILFGAAVMSPEPKFHLTELARE